jgi:outer membrane PBP1 activator LpoA protein
MVQNLSARRQLLAGLCIAVLISACGTQPSAPPVTGGAETTSPETELPALDPWLENPVLSRSAALLASGDTALAASILSQLDRSKLSPDEFALYSLLTARALEREGDAARASETLEQVLIGGLELQPQVRQRLQLEHLSILTHAGLRLQAARQASGWLDDAGPSHGALLIDMLWHQLQLLPLGQLQQERDLSIDPHWLGWLELALLTAAVDASPQRQVAALQDWQQQYPDHPFALTPPPGLASLEQLAASTPRRIALVLPLSGPLTRAGQAVLDGYLAAMHAARQSEWPASELLVLDSSQFPSAWDAYRNAIGRGANLVIGPLAKERLPQKSPDAALPVPWLALNWLPAGADNFPAFYQFALSPEDEAAQLAELAWADGARSALLIHPDGEWGASVAGALQERWGRLHGDLRGTANYADSSDYSDSIKNALNIAASERRASRVRQIMSNSIEFTPRRRQDVDAVFLLSGKPQEARSIKPLIAFHYASDLPVYSTSQVYSGKPEPQRDRDLNGIRMLEIPWLLTPGPVRSDIEATAGSLSLAAMYALGSDAHLLHWRLPALAADTASLLRGTTGWLSMDSNGRIHRRLLAATFSNGTPKPRAP